MAIRKIVGPLAETLAKIAKEKGLIIDDDAKAKAKKRNDEIEREEIQAMKIKKFNQTFRQSLWSGQTSINFTFDDWESKKQMKSDLADKLYQRSLSIAKKLANPEAIPQNTLLVGPAGTGKTSLALAITDYIRRNGWRVKVADDGQKYKRYVKVLFIATDEMAALCARKYNDPQVEEHLTNLVKLAQKVDILILDDFGTEGGMKGAMKPVRSDMQEYMYQIANARFKRYSTIITTNNTKSELGIMYNPKLIDRIMATNENHILDFNGLVSVRGTML